MQMSPAVAGLVIAAALAHAIWNTIVKTSSDRLLTHTLVCLTGGLVAAAGLPFLPLPHAGSWPYLILSALLHNGYYFYLLAAYRAGDLSHVYPIARGTGPLIVACLCGPLLGDSLAALGVAGVLLISAGVVGFASGGGLPWRADGRPFLYALATGTFIASYTLMDAAGVRRSGHVISYILWLNCLSPLPLTIFALVVRRGRVRAFLGQHWFGGVAGGIVALGAYGIAVWALSIAGSAHVAALRETSVLFATLIGTRLLGEPFGRRRTIAASAVVAGVVLLNLGS